MKYPNAYQGIRKLFTAEILQIIASICLFCAGLAAVIMVAISEAGGTAAAAVGGLAATVVFMTAFGVLSIIAVILLLVGLKRAGRDEANFNTGFSLALAALILYVAAAVLSAINGGKNVFDDIAIAIANLLLIGSMLYVTRGISNLADDLKDERVAGIANKLYLIYSILLVVETIMYVISSFMRRDPNLEASAGIILTVASVVSFAAYLVYVILLGKAKKMLSK